MRYYVKCDAAPFENTSFADLNSAYDLWYNLSQEYGRTEIIEWNGPHQNVIAEYSWGR